MNLHPDAYAPQVTLSYRFLNAPLSLMLRYESTVYNRYACLPAGFLETYSWEHTTQCLILEILGLDLQNLHRTVWC